MSIYIYLGILITRLYILSAPECTASWYGEPFHGELTTSGVIYDMYAMTGASPTLPMGTVVRFWNGSGDWVDVWIIDGGPWETDSLGYAEYPLRPHPTRQFDLSKAAADSLGNLDDGLYNLRYRIIMRDITGLQYNLHIDPERLCEYMRLGW